ncbi:hypothetical protein [Nocardia farcinica]|uniref:hypothetical protein n=1 Tax=Nocardia farcinica TaxID=37329 RepID=UPI002455C460|nr:hypothetical protein [Nocardia farcinica]
MGTDEQLSLGFEVEQTAWGRWVDPERRTTQARKFMEHVGIVRIPKKPWPPGAPEVKRIDTLVTELFPDMETATSPENSDIADAFICFVGECYITFARAHWFDFAWQGRQNSLYDDVNPALRWLADEDDEEVTAWELMEGVTEHAVFGDGFTLLADEMRAEYQRLEGSEF